MTIQEIEEKFGGKYHKGVIAKNIEAMWDIIGNNYDIEIEQLPTFSITYIIIPDELCSQIKKQVHKEVLSRSMTGKNKDRIIYRSKSDQERYRQEKLEREKQYVKLFNEQKTQEITPYGIYCIKHRGEIIYIGMTTVSFEERWERHRILFKKSDLSPMLLYHSGYSLEDLTFEIMVDLTKEKADRELTPGEIKAMEMGLIAYFKPKCNVSGVKIPYRFS